MIGKLLASADDLEERVLATGFLPYFKCSIAGFSVEEMTMPSRLWDLEDGPWMWKGDVTRRMNCAYGKFARRKAAYVSLEMLPDLLNFRRYMYNNYTEPSTAARDLTLYYILRDNESLLSGELKSLGGYSAPRRVRRSPLEKMLEPQAPPKRDSAFDASMTRLQMAGLVTIADFEYQYDRQGNRRGWGIARYTTPEALFGSDIATAAGIPPLKSYDRLVNRLMALKFPGATPQAFYKLLNF